ncbi:unnamed protein product [Blepharisma stoltei]|uniref:Receptor ligand binding region domain-containing protein n=1 Tax=Blepharisma stoltei TaxID=1481888 RepID=A0AAU9JJQ0_9CILI|nr:unnamed protein product [Blepharisma stoltei]
MPAIFFAQPIFKIFQFLVIFAISGSSEILIVYSNFTKSALPGFMADIRSSYKDMIDIFYCDIFFLDYELSQHSSLSALFDITNSISYQFEICKISEANSLAHFLVSDRLPCQNKWTFLLSSSQKDLNEAFITVLSYFNWTDGVAISDVEKHSSLSMDSKYFSRINIFTAESHTQVEDLVERKIMGLGSSLFYLFLDKEISIEFQKSLITSKLLVAGAGILLIQDSSYDSNLEGSLAIVDKGKEHINSKSNYLLATFSEMIKILGNISSSEDALKLISKACLNSYCVTEFSLINIHKGQRKIVGSIKSSKLILNASIIFPGNSTEIPKSSKKILYFSASNGPTDPGGNPQPSCPINARGITLAVKNVNTIGDILQNFYLKLNDFDCGVGIYNPAFCLACFGKDISKLGLAHVGGLTSGMALGEIETFKKLNVTIPMVSATNTDTVLSNSTFFPFYSRVSLSNYGYYAQIPLLLKAMGWNSMAIIYQNISNGISVNHYVSQTAAKQNIKILNSQRVIPASTNREQLRNWTKPFQEVIDLHVRFVFLVLNAPLCNYALELFYDLGIRKGDIFIFSFYSDQINSIANDDDYRYKRLEIGIPLMIALPTNFVGNKGKQIYDELYTEYNKTEPGPYSCPYYDAAYLIGNALEWTISKGADYSDPVILQKSIRDIKFIGCTGTVYIQKGSNDRLPSSITVQANSYSPETGITVYTVGYLRPYSSTVLTIIHPIIYSDGTINKPTDFRVTRTDCPFDNKLKRVFPKGRALVFGICFFVALVTAIATFIIWRKWWNIKVDELMKRQEISIQDFIVGLSIGIEFFQLIAMGPDIRPINSFIADIGDLTSLDLGTFVKLQNGVFWWLLTVVISLCALWILLCFEVLYQLDEKYGNIWFFKFSGFLADNLMPILGNLCFIPFVSTLLDVFVCDESIGNNFTESYLANDCYQFCWQSTHIVYVVLSSFALICYEPFAVFCRPLWQELQSNLHVKSIPLYLMTKTIIQVILVVMNKTLKRGSKLAHGFAFTAVIIFKVCFIWKFKAYNYGRFNWWQLLSLIGVAWIAFLATFGSLYTNSNFPYTALIVCGWILITSVGLFVQRKKFPSLLFRKKGKDTSTLFRFAFTFGKNSRVLKSKITPQTLDWIKNY